MLSVYDVQSSNTVLETTCKCFLLPSFLHCPCCCWWETSLDGLSLLSKPAFQNCQPKSRGFVDHPCHNSILRFSDCCLHRSDDFLNLDIEEMHLLKIDEERYNYIPHTPSLISWRKFQWLGWRCCWKRVGGWFSTFLSICDFCRHLEYEGDDWFVNGQWILSFPIETVHLSGWPVQVMNSIPVASYLFLMPFLCDVNRQLVSLQIRQSWDERIRRFDLKRQ